MRLKKLFSESITFSIPSEDDRASSSPCPKCGLTRDAAREKYGASIHTMSYDEVCDHCYSMGGAMNKYEMNVANSNARIILRMLGVNDGEYFGDLDPRQVIAALTMADPSKHTRPSSDNHGVKIDDKGVGQGARIIDMGLPTSQVQGYIDRLMAIAQRAAELGEPIIYG